MNHIYKVIFNKAIGAFVAVAEFAKAHGKSSSGTVGSVNYPKLSNKLFTITALTSGVILLSNPALAATGNNNCTFDTTRMTLEGKLRDTNSLICGTATTNNGGHADSIVIGAGATTPRNGSGTGSTSHGAISIGTNSTASGTATHVNRQNPVHPDINPEGIKVDTSSPSVSIGTSSESKNGGTSVGSSAKSGALAVAVGAVSKASGSSVAIGPAAYATGDTSIAIGRQAVATGSFANAIGNVSGATGTGSFAVGHSTLTEGTRSIAIGTATSTGVHHDAGTQTYTKGADSIALGTTARVETGADNAIAMGKQAQASKDAKNAIAIGNETEASGKNSVAMGTKTLASQNSSVAIGDEAQAFGIKAVTIGQGATSSDQYATAIGSAKAQGHNTFAVGQSTLAQGERSIAIGTSGAKDYVPAPNKEGKEQPAVTSPYGGETYTKSADSIALGTTARVESGADNAIAMGTKAKINASAKDSVAIGNTAVVSKANSIAIGKDTSTGNTNSVAVGVGTKTATGADSAIAIGNKASVNNNDSIAVGTNASTSAVDAVAVGNGATATNSNSIALGAGSETKAATGVTNASSGNLVYGNFAGVGSEVAGSVSVGMAGGERQIHHVAAGAISATSTDAINGSQLYATNKVLDTFVKSVEKGMGGDTKLAKDKDGTLTFKDIGETKKDTVHDAIIAVKEQVQAGSNVQVKDASNDKGQTVYTIHADKAITAQGDGISVASEEVKDTNGTTTTTYTVALSDATKKQLAKEESVVAGKNITVASDKTNSTGGKEYTVTLNNNLDLTGDGSIEVGGITADKSGINMGNKNITNLAAGTADTDAVNVSQLKGAKTEVVKGTNIASVTSGKGTNGQTIYTINADGTKVSKGSDYVTVTAGAKDANNVTDYKVDLAQGVKDSLGKADSAMQSFNTTVNGKDSKTISDKGVVNFVDGDNIAITRSGDDIKVSTKKDVSFNSVTVGKAVIDQSGINAGNQKITNVAAGTYDTDAVNVKQLKDFQADVASKQIGVKAGKNVSIDFENNNTMATINADGTSVSTKSKLISVKKGDKNADLITDYEIGVNVGNLTNNNKGVVSGGSADQVATTQVVQNAVNNSGFNIRANAGAEQFVKNGATVSFVDGTATEAVRNDSSIKYNVKYDDSTIKVNDQGQLYATLQAPKTTTLSNNATTGVVSIANGGNKDFVLADTVTNAINNAGFITQVNGKEDKLVKTGNKVDFVQGKNITITRKGDNGIEVKTNDDVTFNKVTANNVTVGKVIVDDKGINAGSQNITNVKAGTADTHAVNVKQLKDEIGNSTMQYTGDNNTVTVKRKPSEVLTIKGGAKDGTANNIKTIANANGSVEVQLAKDITGIDSITTNGGVKIDNAGINAGNKVISNVATGVKGTDAVNVDQLKEAVLNANTGAAAAKTEVKEGTNIASVDEEKGDKGQSIYTINADGASVSGTDKFVTVTAGKKDAKNVTDYKVDLAKEVKDSLGKADSAMQSFDTQVNGTKVATINNGGKVNFVNGTNTTAVNQNGAITFNVNTQALTNNADGTVKGGVANKFADSINVQNAINNSGFSIQANGGASELVKTGQTVNFVNGDNITITRNGKNVTVATKKDVAFDKVTTNTIDAKEGTVANDGNKNYITEGSKNIVNGGDVYNYVTNTETQYTGDNGSVIVKRKPSEVLTIKGGAKDGTANNIKTIANANGSVEVQLAKNITGVDSIKTGDVTVGKDGIDAGNKVISNVAKGKDGKDAVNVDQLNEAIDTVTTTATAAKTEVKEGTNIAKIDKSTGDKGQDIYTINADGAKVSGTDKFVTVTAGAKDANNVTDYKVDLAQGVKDSLGKADSAIQSFDTKVNGTKVDTIANAGSVNFVNGTGTTARANGKNITFDINKADVVVKDGVASNTKTGDTFVTGDQVVEALNNTGFNTAVNGKDKALVKNGNTVNFKDGSNIEITRNKEGDIVVSTTKNAGFDSVKVGDTVTINKDGINAGDTKITNVKDGDINATSTDAVNGKQIHDIVEKINNATNAAKTEVKAGTNTQVTDAKGKDGQTVYTVHADKAITAQGDGISVASKEVKDANGTTTTTYTVALSEDTKKQLAKEESVVAGNNITVTSDKTNSTGGKEYTVALNNNLDLGDKGSVKMGDVSISNNGLDNGGNKITNIGKGDVSANSTDAVNGGQLHEVKELVENSGFNIQANGGDKEFVKNGETVNFKEGDNVTITRDGKDITVTTKKDVSFDSVKVGDVTINNNGINAGNKVISNVADGKKPSDAVNVKQLTDVENTITKTIGGKIETITKTIEENGKKETITTEGLVDKDGEPFHTYNVYGQTERLPKDVLDAIKLVNEHGTKFFHTNDGVITTINEGSNTIDASASGRYSTAIGYRAKSQGANSVALGSDSEASAWHAVAIGNKSKAKERGVAMGESAEAGLQGIAIGDGAKATGRQSISIGTKNVVTGNHSGAFGDPNKLEADSSYAIGNNNVGTGYKSEYIHISGSNNKVGVDKDGKTTQVKNTTVTGHNNTVNSGVISRGLDNAHIVGNNNTVNSDNTFVLGSNIVADKDGNTVANSVYLGNNTTVTSGNSIGTYNLTTEGRAVFGRNTTAGDKGTVNEVIFVAKGDGTDKGSMYTPIGYAAATAHGAVSVGAAGGERRVQNVAAGEISKDSTDAINGSQLYALGQSLKKSGVVVSEGRNIRIVKTSTREDGVTNYTVHTEDDVVFDSVKAGDVYADNVVTKNLYAGPVVINNNGIDAGNTQITGVADGINDTDAVNVGQMNKAINSAVGTEVVAGENTIVERGVGENGQNVYRVHADLDPAYKRIDNVKDEANAGISSAMAMASLPQAYMPGKSMLTGGVATYNGEGAVAVGLSKLSDNGRWVLKMSGSADTQGNLGGAVGAGFHF